MPLTAETTHSNHRRHFIALPIEAIPKNIPLPYPIYVRVDNKMVLFRVTGDTLILDRVSRLKDHAVKTVFIDLNAWDRFLKEQEQNCESIDHSNVNPENISKIRSLFFAYAANVENQKALDPNTFRKVQQLCDRLSDCLISVPSVLGSLLQRYPSPELYLSNHTINVAIYSAAIAMKLRLPKRTTHELLIAGFLHNLGITQIPDATVYKSTPLSDDEWVLIRRHPDVGAQIAANAGASKTIVDAIRASHERMDGKGYAHKMHGQGIPIMARILSIADVYDALVSHRPWEKAHTPAEALAIMRSHNGKFDPAIFTAFG